MKSGSAEGSKPWRNDCRERYRTRLAACLDGVIGFLIEANAMNLELADRERDVIRNALKVYLSDLRAEITKTEKHEWKAALHDEENVLKQVIDRLG